MASFTGRYEHQPTEQGPSLNNENRGYRQESENVLASSPDSGKAADLLLERLITWRQVCQYLISYVSATAKEHRSHSKEYRNIMKSVNNPLRESHQFVSSSEGVGGLFETIYMDTARIAAMYAGSGRDLEDNLLPILDRLLIEIKNKMQDLERAPSQISRALKKARQATKKHIALLGRKTHSYDVAAHKKIERLDDPYLARRGVDKRLSEQVEMENTERQDILKMQDSFLWFEMHVLHTVQATLAKLFQHVDGRLDRQKILYGDILCTAQLIRPDMEWNEFIKRNNRTTLLDPDSLPRVSTSIKFPNMDHEATKPLIKGTLKCLSRSGTTNDYGYYVVTLAGYLHEFENNSVELFSYPVSRLSLYLPDCTVKQIDPFTFSVKGVDVSGGKIGSTIHAKFEYKFRIQTSSGAYEWCTTIQRAVQALNASKLQLAKANGSTGRIDISP